MRYSYQNCSRRAKNGRFCAEIHTGQVGRFSSDATTSVVRFRGFEGVLLITRIHSSFVAFSVLMFTLGASAGYAQTAQNPARLEVDLREAPQHIFHAKLTLPVTSGSLTLVYPKWIPGEHSPTGPIADLVGLKIAGGGKDIPWRRDDVDMYAFHVEVPAGVEHARFIVRLSVTHRFERLARAPVVHRQTRDPELVHGDAVSPGPEDG